MTALVNWRNNAVALELLSFSFRQPGIELVESLVSGEWLAACRDLEGVGCLSLPEGFGRESLTKDARGNEVADAEKLLHELNVEATRLFIGLPDPDACPYEGIWRAVDEGVQPLMFVNRSAMEVKAYMRSCGVKQPEGTNEPLDHVATELAFMQYLSMLEAGMTEPFEGSVASCDMPGGSAEAAYETFVREHAGTWMGRFAQKTLEMARLPFYRTAAELLKAYLG